MVPRYIVEVENLLILISMQLAVPIPVPVFYDKIAIYGAGIEGAKGELVIQFPRPELNMKEAFQLLGDLTTFFSDEDFVLPVSSYGEVHTPDEPLEDSIVPVFSAGPIYLELPGIMGYQILAISPDSPASLKKTELARKTPVRYKLLSDSDAQAIKSFGLAFKVDDELIEKYKGFGIDLEAASGKTHHLLPVPGAYIVNTKGIIEFAYSNTDYKIRVPREELLAAAEQALSH